MLRKCARIARSMGSSYRESNMSGFRTKHVLITVITVLLIIGLTRCSSSSKTGTETQNDVCGDGGGSSATAPPLPGLYPLNPGPAGTFFGINTNDLGASWPATGIPVTSWRSHGGGVKWADINTGPGAYDFSRLDRWLSEAKTNNTDIMFTIFATPSWASSHGVNSSSPNPCCDFAKQNGPGTCDPPADLNCDGTGTNETFISFVTALVQHAGPGTIKYWELWNEPNVAREWNANADCANSGVEHPSQVMLARMAKDLKNTVIGFDPNAKFTTPAATAGSKAGDWLGLYLTSTDGGNYADINAFHGYINNSSGCPSDCPIAEAVGDQIDHLNALLPASAQGKPLFDTEGFWGDAKNPDGSRTTAITDPDQQASFVVRYYLIQMWKRVAKFYWWTWDISNQSAFYNSSSNLLTAPGNAYVRVVQWTNGGAATVGPCGTDPSVATLWTCTIHSASGAVSEAIWDTSQTCSSGTCTTTNVNLSSLNPPFSFNAYLDLSGNVTAISNQSVPVGLKPILMVKQ